MHRRALIPAQFFTLSLLALVGVGCGQAEGERCQVDLDCQSGLRCDLSKGGSPYMENGTCRSSSASIKLDAGTKSDTSTSSTPDSAIKVDTLPRDVAPDLVSKVDSKPDTADTKADAPQASDATVDAPQPADAPADALSSSDASDGRVD